MAILGGLCGSFSCSSIFSSWLLSFTNDVTGSLWLSLFAMFLIIYVLMLYAGLPNELALLMMIPFAIVGSLITDNWYAFIGIITFYTGFLIVRNLN